MSKYHRNPSLWNKTGSDIIRIRVIAHETGHFLGLPDLYDTDGSGSKGLGNYCLMANNWGPDGSQKYLPHLSAWSKVQLGWVKPIVILTSGSYSARKSCEFKDIFLIGNGTANFGSGEYLLIENRQRCKFDAKIPSTGLAIYHIDDTAAKYTTEGYPGSRSNGQTGWPTNGNHY